MNIFKSTRRLLQFWTMKAKWSEVYKVLKNEVTILFNQVIKTRSSYQMIIFTSTRFVSSSIYQTKSYLSGFSEPIWIQKSFFQLYLNTTPSTNLLRLEKVIPRGRLILPGHTSRATVFRIHRVDRTSKRANANLHARTHLRTHKERESE